MWLHIERLAATNATLSPMQIAQKLTWLSSGIWPYIGRVRVVCCKFKISVILSSSMCHYGDAEVLWEKKVAARARRRGE